MADLLIRDLMTPIVIALDPATSLLEAARVMRDADIGVIPVVDDGRLCGMVTDRDIVVRAVAEESDPRRTSLGAVISALVFVARPDQPASAALALMSDHALRRVPVVDDAGELVGMVSLGDIAMTTEPSSVLSDITASPGNH
jgi:CBS domain-containing protein